MSNFLDVHDVERQMRRDFEPDQNLFVGDEGYSSPTNETFVNFAPVDDFGPQALEDMEGLLHLGFITESFNLFGHAFVIRTLRRGEKLAVGQLVAEFEGTIGLADAFATAYVAACVVTVDGRSLTAPLGLEDSRNPLGWIRMNWSVVCQWFDPVIEMVYEKYSNIVNRQTQAFLAIQGKS